MIKRTRAAGALLTLAITAAALIALSGAGTGRAAGDPAQQTPLPTLDAATPTPLPETPSGGEATEAVPGHALGPDDAYLTIVMYGDFQCEPCARYARDLAVLRERYPDDLRLIFTSLVENRYFQRSVEYQHQEAIALNTGVTKMNVQVETYPDDVLERFAEASKVILNKEMEKGPKAREMGEKLTSLMKDLGYA